MKPLTQSEKIHLSTTEIAKLIRQQLKKEYPKFKFSITSKYYSMGSSITISLMESPIKVIKDYKDLSELALLHTERNNYTKEQIEHMQKEKYHQLNQYILRHEYNPDTWNNGVFLTKEGHKVMQRAVKISDQYNFDESDSMTDYYFVNFSLHIQVGKWNKDYRVIP